MFKSQVSLRVVDGSALIELLDGSVNAASDHLEPDLLSFIDADDAKQQAKQQQLGRWRFLENGSEWMTRTSEFQLGTCNARHLRYHVQDSRPNVLILMYLDSDHNYRVSDAWMMPGSAGVFVKCWQRGVFCKMSLPVTALFLVQRLCFWSTLFAACRKGRQKWKLDILPASEHLRICCFFPFWRFLLTKVELFGWK